MKQTTIRLTVFTLLFVSFTVILTSCGGNEEAPQKKPASPVDFIVVSYEEVDNIITVPGTVLPFEMVELYSEINGRVKKITFKEGQFVTKGTALVVIDTDILQAQRKQLSVSLDLAQKDEKRKKALLDSKATSMEEYEKAQSNLANIEAQIALLDVQISKGTIRAPFSGRIGLRNISEGAYINPTTLITTIAQNDMVKIEFSVAERYANRVKTGQQFSISNDDDSLNVNAEVYAFAPTINNETRMLTIRGTAGKSDELYPGSFVNVSYNLGVDKKAIRIPNSSIVPVMKGQQVWVIKKGLATAVPIETGQKSSDKTQVFGEISVGDTIITTGLLGMKAGAPVVTKKSNK